LSYSSKSKFDSSNKFLIKYHKIDVSEPPTDKKEPEGVANPLASPEREPPSPVSLKVNMNGRQKEYRQVSKPQGPCYLHEFMTQHQEQGKLPHLDLILKAVRVTILYYVGCKIMYVVLS
jgi:hypothetical protein